MTRISRLVVVAALAGLLLPGGMWAQDTLETRVRSSLALRAGYSLPAGEWAKSRIASNVQFFTGSLTGGGDLSFFIGKDWVLVLGGGYTKLNGSDWEGYTRTKGDNVVVSGSLTDVSIAFRRYLVAASSNMLSFELGAVGLFADGQEVVDGEQYEYDFFGAYRIGGMGALEFDRLITSTVALSVRAELVVIPSGMSYVDGDSRTIIYAPLSAGFRFLF